MTPLGGIAAGLVLVVADFRVQGWDVLPDVLGWLLIVVGLLALRKAHDGFSALTVLAVVAAVLSLATLRFPVTVDVYGSVVTEAVGGQRIAVELHDLLVVVLVVWLFFALAAAARAWRDEAGERRFRLLAWANVALLLTSLVGVLLARGADGGDVPGLVAVVAVVFVLFGIAVLVAGIVSLVQWRESDWALRSYHVDAAYGGQR